MRTDPWPDRTRPRAGSATARGNASLRGSPWSLALAPVRFSSWRHRTSSSWAPGSAAHIFAQALNEKFKLSIEVVNYKGEAPMWQDMGAASLQAAMGSPQAFNALLVKGEIKPIVRRKQDQAAA